MKRIICFLCISAWILSLNAGNSSNEDVVKDYKDSTEFSMTGTKWYANLVYTNSFSRDYSNTPVCYSLGTDTLIDGNIWRRLYEGKDFLAYIRESEGRVWAFSEYLDNLNWVEVEKGKPFMLYDFSLQKGDTIYENEGIIGYTYAPIDHPDNWPYPIVVKDVRFEHGRKVIDFGFQQWIEGVGSAEAPFFSRWMPVPTNGSSYSETIYQVASNGKTIYFNGEVADPNATPWMKSGMTWTQNWNYNETSDGQFRQITLGEEVRPGTFTFSWTGPKYWYPFDKLQDFNGKVYAIDEYFNNFELCYDFTLQEGDNVEILSLYDIEDPIDYSYPIREYDTCTVSKVDSVEINGVMRKRFTLTGDRDDVWIEGVGSLSHVFPIDERESTNSTVYNPSRITCLRYDGKNIYLHPDFIDCTTPQANKEPICSWVGAVWSYCSYRDSPESHSFFRYTVLDRPEVIDGLTYYPLVKYRTCEYQEGDEVEATFRIRQKGSKVYMKKEDFESDYKYKDFVRFREEGNDYILYDFSLEKNEEYCWMLNSMNGQINDTISIRKIDTIQTFNKQNLKRLAIRRKNIEIRYYLDLWIEGIGSTYDLLEPFGHTKVDCSCYKTLNYFCSADSSIIYRNPRRKEANEPPQYGYYFDSSYYDHFKEDDCALNPSKIGEVADVSPFIIQVNGSTISCTSPTATKLEIYTMDAVKVGEAAFANGEAAVKVGKIPATYLYIVTYPNGRRESGKVAVKN
ncbi:MAG: hypothetical protein IKA75_02235 [Bacteroidaceae bacterium]|nr:hypothetical protein [Bacteroidaceae bacterium]